ncbi:hypothetical protein V7088_06075 [Priestia megaterium]|uniref:hypothetical protein n=1 Tax=Priestia megaterium TaxID=1404 RepID=UPI000BF2C8ED|nr:hypothetical protein [Priestia megaterium]PFP32633.1 hypothetical protein COK03_27425 [Priestia megaterium]
MTKDSNPPKPPLNPALQKALRMVEEQGGFMNKVREVNDLTSRLMQPQYHSWHDDIPDSKKRFAELQQARIQEEVRKEREHEEREKTKIALLQDIKANTTVLKEMNYHLELNNAHQREIIDLMIEALSIMKSDNEKEAKSNRDNFIGKVQSLNTLRDSVETAQWLIGMAKSAYVMYQTLS